MSSWSDLKNIPRLKNIYDTRTAIIKAVREFFWLQDFKETDTPIGVRLASQEPYLNPLLITMHDPHGKSEKFYLRTSPEYALKKLLAVGYEKVFEIGKCFRDFESFGGNHNPEFTMLEWYRAPGNLSQIMDDTENLFRSIAEKLNIQSLQYRDTQIKIFEPWDRVSMKGVWQKYVGINLDDCLQRGRLYELAISKKYAVSPEDAYEDIFYKIFLTEIEPKLGLERPVFIYDYPAQMTSLSKLCEQDNRYAQRFELYIGGLEVANAFGELTDAEEQQIRLEKDKDLRAALGKEIWPVDPDFIGALAALPAGASAQVGGIALGIDRMVLLCTGAKDLNEVIFQSVKDQIN